MNYILFGEISKPVIILLGTWDPLIDDYYKMIDVANNYCINNDYQLLLVLLDPFPADLYLEQMNPIFDCCDIRISILEQKCHGAICKMTMAEKDLEFGVEYFLQIFQEKYTVRELWLKPNQSLGRGEKSLPHNIKNTCLELGVELKIKPLVDNFRPFIAKVKQYLLTGNIEAASSIVGHSPIWKKSKDQILHIGWETGKYLYQPSIFSCDHSIQTDNCLYTLNIYHNEQKKAVFNWPNNDVEIISILKRINC